MPTTKEASSGNNFHNSETKTIAVYSTQFCQVSVRAGLYCRVTRLGISWETCFWVHLWGRSQKRWTEGKAILHVGGTNTRAGVPDWTKGGMEKWNWEPEFTSPCWHETNILRRHLHTALDRAGFNTPLPPFLKWFLSVNEKNHEHTFTNEIPTKVCMEGQLTQRSLQLKT